MRPLNIHWRENAQRKRYELRSKIAPLNAHLAKIEYDIRHRPNRVFKTIPDELKSIISKKAPINYSENSLDFNNLRYIVQKGDYQKNTPRIFLIASLTRSNVEIVYLHAENP